MLQCTVQRIEYFSIFKQTSIRRNSASRRAREGLKKGKSSEFNPQNNEQVKSSPALKVWSHESVKVTVKFEKRVKLRVP